MTITDIHNGLLECFGYFDEHFLEFTDKEAAKIKVLKAFDLLSELQDFTYIQQDTQVSKNIDKGLELLHRNMEEMLDAIKQMKKEYEPITQQ